MNGKRKAIAGFTLIEIMVVVAILVVLIAILVPALGAARAYSKKTATVSQMHGIATACEGYYVDFQAYPGVLSESAYDGGASPSIMFSSSQSLLVSMSRAFYTAAPTAPLTASTVVSAATTNIPAPFYTCDNPAISPADYSTNGGTGIAGTGRTYQPLLNPSPNQLSPTIGVFTSNIPSKPVPKGVDVPVIIDSAYSTDALPILYYRAARKYDPNVANTAGQGMNTVGDTAVGGAAPFAAFYGASNDWIFDQQNQTNPVPPNPSSTFNNCGKLTADDAKQVPMANGTDSSGAHTQALRNLLFNQVPTSTGTNYVAKGGFVLISAGPDRYFGPNPNKGNAVDDIVIAGGN